MKLLIFSKLKFGFSKHRNVFRFDHFEIVFCFASDELFKQNYSCLALKIFRLNVIKGNCVIFFLHFFYTVSYHFVLCQSRAQLRYSWMSIFWVFCDVVGGTVMIDTQWKLISIFVKRLWLNDRLTLHWRID
jgi:hypothetical protein